MIVISAKEMKDVLHALFKKHGFTESRALLLAEVSEYETAISQVYLCICPEVFPDKELQHSLINEIIDYTHDVTPSEEGKRTYYPGEQSANAKKRNDKNGMKVSKEIWRDILTLLEE